MATRGSAKRARRARKGRTEIAQMFAMLENGNVRVTDVLQDPPHCLRRIRAYDVLRRFPKLGRDGAEKVLSRARVWPLTTMGNLTVQERSRILHELPPRVRK